MEEAREIFPLVKTKHPQVFISQHPRRDGLESFCGFQLPCNWSAMENGPEQRKKMLQHVTSLLIGSSNVTAYAIQKMHDVAQNIFVFGVYSNGTLNCFKCHATRVLICHICRKRTGIPICANNCCETHVWQQIGLFFIVELKPDLDFDLAHDLIAPISYIPPPVLPDLNVHMKAIELGII